MHFYVQRRHLLVNLLESDTNSPQISSTFPIIITESITLLWFRQSQSFHEFSTYLHSILVLLASFQVLQLVWTQPSLLRYTNILNFCASFSFILRPLLVRQRPQFGIPFIVHDCSIQFSTLTGMADWIWKYQTNFFIFFNSLYFAVKQFVS